MSGCRKKASKMFSVGPVDIGAAAVAGLADCAGCGGGSFAAERSTVNGLTSAKGLKAALGSWDKKQSLEGFLEVGSDTSTGATSL